MSHSIKMSHIMMHRIFGELTIFLLAPFKIFSCVEMINKLRVKYLMFSTFNVLGTGQWMLKEPLTNNAFTANLARLLLFMSLLVST